MALKKFCPSKNLICRGSFSSSFAPFDFVRFRNKKARDDFFDNFSKLAIHSKRQVILSNFPDTPLPCVFSSRGWASLFEKPSRCPNMFILEFYSNMHAINTSVPRFTTVFWGTRIVVTPKLIFKVLHAPMVDFPNYPSHRRLASISRDKLASLFYEKAMLWRGTLNFYTTEFAKGPRILNMVMTFVPTTRSHYNTISKPHAHFLLSLIESLFVDFPSHMIISIIDRYQDTAICDKLIFHLAITRILTHMDVTIPPSPLFHVIGAISKESIRRSVGLLQSVRMWRWRMQPLQPLSLDPLPHLPLLPPLGQMSPLLTLWTKFSLCMLILVVVLTIFLMRYVKWTSESITLLTANSP